MSFLMSRLSSIVFSLNSAQKNLLQRTINDFIKPILRESDTYLIEDETE